MLFSSHYLLRYFKSHILPFDPIGVTISEAINNFDGGVRALDGVNGTGFIFASFPASYLSNSGAFIDQVDD